MKGPDGELGAGGRFLRSSEKGLHTKNEFARTEWLGDVVVGTQLEPRNPTGHFRLGGEHQDRDLLRPAVGSQFPEDREPILPR